MQSLGLLPEDREPHPLRQLCPQCWGRGASPHWKKILFRLAEKNPSDLKVQGLIDGGALGGKRATPRSGLSGEGNGENRWPIFQNINYAVPEENQNGEGNKTVRF